MEGAQSSLPQQIHPVSPTALSVILDFDGTITREDTLSVLAQHFIDANPEKQGLWTRAVEHYIQDLRVFNESYRVPIDKRVAWQDELDYMRAQRSVELASIERIKQSGLFLATDPEQTREGHAQHMRQVGQRVIRKGVVEFRPGFEQFLKTVLERGWDVGVLSLNWSTDFVKGVMSRLDPRTATQIRFCTNDIDYHSGKVGGPSPDHDIMLTGEDKVACWRDLHPDIDMASAVFVGDGAMDLPCLMAARRGVVIVRDPDKCYPYRALQRMGHSVPHVSAVPADWRFCCDEDFSHSVEIIDNELQS